MFLYSIIWVLILEYLVNLFTVNISGFLFCSVVWLFQVKSLTCKERLEVRTRGNFKNQSYHILSFKKMEIFGVKERIQFV